MVDGADGGVVDPWSGRPIVGAGTLLVATGGPNVQKVVSYLEVNASPVRFRADATHFYFDRRDSTNIVTALVTDSTANHDYFLVELVKDPTTGSLTLVAYGFEPPGTAAAAWYFANTVMPQSGGSPTGWYVVEWTDTNGNGIPDATDTFTVMLSGS
jgi:hypothetical protein